MDEELKACPFCGSKTVDFREAKHWTGSRFIILSVSLIHHCNDEKFPSYLEIRGNNRLEAIRKWNNRT